MSNYVKLATEAGDQYLAALADSQEQFLKYAKTFAAWAPTVTPSAATTSTEDFLPTPREMFEANMAFTTKLLKQQKTFVDKLFAVSAS